MDLIAYGERQTVTDREFWVLDALYTRWLSLDPQYWTDTKHVTGLIAHANAMKAGMSEWYPVDKLPAAVQVAEVFEPLALRGWVELTKEHDYWGRVTACARITWDGIDAWKRHQDTCYRVWAAGV